MDTVSKSIDSICKDFIRQLIDREEIGLFSQKKRHQFSIFETFEVKLIDTVNTRSYSFFSTNPDCFGISAANMLKRFVPPDIKYYI